MDDARQYLNIGTKGEAEVKVEENQLASRYASGELDVYATPAMVALMEQAAVRATDGSLPSDWITVGMKLDVRHLHPTLPGATVRAEAELEAIDGRRLVFKVMAFDGIGRIGEGVHERFCVERPAFLADAKRRAAK